MGDFQEAVTVYTNFITPPDFLQEEKHTLTVVDATDEEINQLALWCKTAKSEFNVYIYNHNLNDAEWLEKAIVLSSAVIVNTVTTELSPVKDRLVDLPNTYYYGPKRFITNAKHMNSLLEYFEKYEDLIK